MSPMGERGSVLAQVLVAMVLMAIITTSIMHTHLQTAVNTANSITRTGEDLAARAALSRLTEAWTRLGSCASDAAAGVVCDGAGCACRCVVGSVVVTALPQGGACSLTAAPMSSP